MNGTRNLTSRRTSGGGSEGGGGGGGVGGGRGGRGGRTRSNVRTNRKANRETNRNGLVVYHGPSRIEGSEIIVIATGLHGRASANVKTGAMVQTWILRADRSPIEALRTGADAAICGGCVFRPESYDGRTYYGRACYVNVAQAPSSVWRTWQRGRYAAATSPEHLADAFAGRIVRLGSYGDPAAVPLKIWEAMLSRAAAWTGYTHQARSPKLRDVLRYCQVSADCADDARAARAAGVGSFRVLRTGETPLAFEMLCPASKEAGHVTTCVECRACSGFNGANVAIGAHGIGAKAYATRESKRRPLALPILNTARV